MAKFMFIVLAVIATGYSAVVINKETLLRRVARSPCDSCRGDQGSSVLPAPPIPLLRTQNWSGHTRSSDGTPSAVFSGAAAEADQGTQTAGQAFSLAASSAAAGFDESSNSGLNAGPIKNNYDRSSGVKGGFSSNGYGSDGQRYSSSNYKETRFAYQSGGVGKFDNQLTGGHKDIADSALSTAQSSPSGTNGVNRDELQQQNVDGDLAESRNTERLDGNGGYHQSNQGGQTEGIHSASSSAQSGSGSEKGDSALNNNFRSGYSSHNGEKSFSHHGNGNDKYGTQRQVGGSHGEYDQGRYESNVASGNREQHSGYDQYHNSRHKGQQDGAYFGSGQNNGNGFGAQNGQFQESDSVRQVEEQAKVNSEKQENQLGVASGQKDSGYYGGQASSNAEGQASLQAALNLASQGLQTAHQSGCSTCGKSSYALSNAKSHSGSAIALSIGG